MSSYAKSAAGALLLVLGSIAHLAYGEPGGSDSGSSGSAAGSGPGGFGGPGAPITRIIAILEDAAGHKVVVRESEVERISAYECKVVRGEAKGMIVSCT